MSDESLTDKIANLASYCKNSGQCSLACPTHFVGLFNPTGVLRDVQMYGPERAIQKQNIFNCLVCNRCMVDCPSASAEGLDFALLIRYLRTYAVDHNISPGGKAEKPGICHIIHEINDKKKPQNSLPNYNIHQYLEPYKDLKYTSTGSIAYFAAPIEVFVEKSEGFDAEYEQIPRAVVKILNLLRITPVVLNLKASGHDDLWAGNFDVFKALAEYNYKQMVEAGVKTVICESAQAFHTLKFEYPKIIPDFDFEVLHLSEFLIQEDRYKKLSFRNPLPVRCAYHDDSRLGRMGGEIYEAPRKVLAAIPGVTLIEMEENKQYSYDCAQGVYMPENESTKTLWANYMENIKELQVDYLVSGSIQAPVHYNSICGVIQMKKSPRLPALKDFGVFVSRFL